ncbi:LysR family transcriptional regulator [Phyllobacterium sp. LjRoot231]|uniref:LysR family transcriptional regulator n=1 Tax=Phyllobacterium sp. LjRoot231 TaxID=3342289 RepID=UPI003ECF19BD
MNLRQLRYFITVARLGSFTAAARILNVSQPALGYQLKLLEDQLGVALLQRHSRGVRVTEAGSTLLETGTRALEAFAEAERSVAHFGKANSKRISLGVAPTPGRALLPELLPLAAGAGEVLQIVVQQGMSDELIDAMTREELDAALCYDPPDLPHIRIVPLYKEYLYLICAGSAASSVDSTIPFDSLSEYPLVLDGKVRPIRRLIDEIATSRQTKLDLIEVEPANVKREIIMHHGRSTIVPYGLFLDEIRERRVTARRITDPQLERTVALVLHQSLSPGTGHLLEALIRPLVKRIVESGELGWRNPDVAFNEIA